MASTILSPELAPIQFHSDKGIAAIPLFRGFSGSVISSAFTSGDTSGIEQIGTRISNKFRDVRLKSKVFDSVRANFLGVPNEEVGSAQALSWLNGFNNLSTIGTVGFSSGGLSTHILAQEVNRLVDLLVQISSVDALALLNPSNRQDVILPKNVIQGINYYQVAGTPNMLDRFGGAENVQGSENINAEIFLNDNTITHTNIDDNVFIQNLVLNHIDDYVLSKLEFDRRNELVLNGSSREFRGNLQLTGNRSSSVGSAFFKHPFILKNGSSFNTDFQFVASNQNSNGSANGFTFIVHHDVRENSALGGGGIFLGYGGSVQGISDSLAIEFDNNSFGGSSGIRVVQNGSVELKKIKSPFDISRGSKIKVWLNYKGVNDRLNIFLADDNQKPNTPTLSVSNVDLHSIIGPRAYFGFTSATGIKERAYKILDWDLSVKANDPGEVLKGDGDANSLYGYAGNDSLHGYAGNDRLFGGRGKDKLHGNTGNDLLVGNSGVDLLLGGGGDDIFDYNHVKDSGVGSGNRDVIKDFDKNGNDVIDLTDLYSETLAFVGASGLSSQSPSVTYSRNGTDTVVLIDTNGNGAANLEIELLGVTSLTGSDFNL